jgi:hypothetical protein
MSGRTTGRPEQHGRVLRSASLVRSDISDLERLLVDVPPHHGSGTRRSLEERLDDLRAELRHIEADA